MRKVYAIKAGALSFALASLTSTALAAGSPKHWDVLQQYCVDCHNTTDWAGNLNLDGVTPTDVTTDTAAWEKVIRKLQTGMMPPPGKPRPERATLEGFAHALASRIDAAAAKHPHPGGKSLHRLNRSEYRNAVRDVLGYLPGAELQLPKDDSAEGFDNLADVLAVSPTLVQAYIAAAQKIGRAAVGDPKMPATLAKYAGPDASGQDAHVDGLPLGSHGGMLIPHYFPLDAEYEIRVSTSGGLVLGGAPASLPPKIDLLLDGKPLNPGSARKFRIRVPAGPRVLGVSLVEQRHAIGVEDLYSRAPPRRSSVESVTIEGPFDATGTGDTPSRRRIFSCKPTSPVDEPECARRILTTLAGHAYRRPMTANDADVETLMGFYEDGRTAGSFEVGIQQAISRVLVDPQFLFRMEADRSDLAAGKPWRISDVELASRLSFFLWSSIPDDALMADAARGRLHDPKVLERHVRRMLADSRSSALVENFGGQWLAIRQLANAKPLDRAFDDALRDAMADETRLFFDRIKQDDRSVLEILDGRQTFLNERLAHHYGIEGVRGSYLRAVQLPEDSVRRGVLGKGSVLAVTSAGDRTSPVTRGVWVMEGLLGAHVPAPPPGVEADLKESPTAEAPKSVRERLLLHRSNASCASCHQVIDPLGFAMENFDLLGRWRTTETNGTAIDARDSMVDGTVLNGVGDLRKMLTDRPEAFVVGFSEKLLTYALGRRLEAADQVAVRRIVSQAGKDNYRLSSIVLAITGSVPFQMKAAIADCTGDQKCTS